jgi:glycosyltransferase involved in cell wall biosynthesis
MISGAAHVAQQVARGMAQRGHQVLVIAASDRSNAYCEKNGNLTTLRLASLHNPLRVGQRFLLYPNCEIWKALREFQPDMIHTHEPAQMGIIGARYAKCAQIPIALTVHQLPGYVATYLPRFCKGYVETLLWMYARHLCRKFTTLITPTQTISNIVTKMTGHHAHTIGFGLDLQTFRPAFSRDEETATRQKWNLPLGVPLLLHVGRLDPDKRVDQVIQAAAQTMHGHDVHLLIVGDGTQKPALINLCNSLGISERVHFPGFISANEGLPEIYRVARLFVTASEIETQGIVLLEAAASGLPLVAVNATCIPEIVHDGINGFLAEPGKISMLASAMSLLLNDQEKTGNLGRASRELAQRQGIHSTIEAHVVLYHQLVRQARVLYVQSRIGQVTVDQKD